MTEDLNDSNSVVTTVFVAILCNLQGQLWLTCVLHVYGTSVWVTGYYIDINTPKWIIYFMDRMRRSDLGAAAQHFISTHWPLGDVAVIKKYNFQTYYTQL